ALGSIEITRITYPVYNLVIILAGFITALTLWIYITKTKTGVVMRAVASDYEMALALGVNIRKVYMQTFIIASAIAGFAGAIIVPTSAAVLGMSIEILILAFVVIVIGGLGSIKGAFLGSLLVGLTRVIGVTYFPKIELVILYAVAAIILIIRPRGLFGK
ncbi:MAG TPA: branched-chain amino acid ABC transporter permease, partial [Candidatus Caldiarchaeum subterraneum]|nr:branched-chain amino acid ABC transporter permease [Candidatus Caldarchaeum subterraneum]